MPRDLAEEFTDSFLTQLAGDAFCAPVVSFCIIALLRAWGACLLPEQIEQANMYLQRASGNLSSACGAVGSSGPSSSGPMVPALPSDDMPMPDDVMGALGDLLAEGQALTTVHELGALMDALPSPSLS